MGKVIPFSRKGLESVEVSQESDHQESDQAYGKCSLKNVKMLESQDIKDEMDHQYLYLPDLIHGGKTKVRIIAAASSRIEQSDSLNPLLRCSDQESRLRVALALAGYL